MAVHNTTKLQPFVVSFILVGRERTLCKLCLNELHEEWKKVGSRTQIQGLKTKEIEKMKSCHIVTSNMVSSEVNDLLISRHSSLKLCKLTYKVGINTPCGLLLKICHSENKNGM